MQSDRNLNENSGISVSINNADCTQSEYENLHENVGCYTEVDSLSSAATCYGCTAQESGVGSVHSQHSASYEEFIRRTPTYFCKSCLRFLFKNQTHRLYEYKLNNITQILNISVSSVLCCTCKKYLAEKKIPTVCAKLNSLEVNQIPTELSELNTLEKKLLSKIQTFFTMIILPGGQYAEKGMVLNLPRNVSVTVESVSSLPDLNQMCVVHFENGEPFGHHSGFLVSPAKLIAAFQWLKEQNRLYVNLTVPSSIQSTRNSSHTNIAYESCTVNTLEQVTLTQVNCSATAEVADCLPVRNSENAQSIMIPKIHNEPVSVYDLDNGGESAFPWLFPEGKFGFSHPRMQ